MAERRSKEEWMILVEEYKVSGVNQTAWCREKGLNKGSFSNYLKKAEALATVSKSEWGSLAIPRKFETSSISLKIGDIILDIKDDFNKETLKDVLNVVMKLC